MFELSVGISFAILISGVQCLIPDFLKADVFNIHRHAAVETRDLLHKPVTPENVTYYLYTSKNPNKFIKLDPSDLEPLRNVSDKLVFLVHGWTSNRETAWYEDLKNAFLTTHPNYSIVEVDWSEPANQYYYVASINTYDVAKILVNVILDLNKNYSVSLDDVLLIGHSLGGQIIGFVGKDIIKVTGRKLPRIIALDPAGPLFDTRPEDKRLNKNDAEVVEVIHSDGGTFGFLRACGTIDFFPNGGKSQPGCKRIDLLDLRSLVDPISCDHRRAGEYFVEAILNPDELLATRCSGWELLAKNQCDDVKVNLGDLTTNETGTFYFETNKERPFSKRKQSDGISLSKVLSLLHH
ncbi:unnamed protein product [Phaedon cochleariae]|uniref:Lipase domain-containing protein n=1 Tax=Phaedon cochleariae TaxID=80249 RepID=A0A9P0GT10_PHACE|nr:unnamed protein product [Phaedon cochleariae]